METIDEIADEFAEMKRKAREQLDGLWEDVEQDLIHMKKILAVSLDKNVAEGFDKFCYDQRIKNRSRLVQSLIEKHMRENFIPSQQ